MTLAAAPDAPDGPASRPEYDQAWPLAEREQAKAADLTAAGVKASARTVRRMRFRYQDQGLWGLVDTRHAPAARPAGNVDPRVVAAAAAVIEAYAGTSTGTRGRLSGRSSTSWRTTAGRAWCLCRRGPLVPDTIAVTVPFSRPA